MTGERGTMPAWLSLIAFALFTAAAVGVYVASGRG